MPNCCNCALRLGAKGINVSVSGYTLSSFFIPSALSILIRPSHFCSSRTISSAPPLPIDPTPPHLSRGNILRFAGISKARTGSEAISLQQEAYTSFDLRRNGESFSSTPLVGQTMFSDQFKEAQCRKTRLSIHGSLCGNFHVVLHMYFFLSFELSTLANFTYIEDSFFRYAALR